jgi:hypothetical protein
MPNLLAVTAACIEALIDLEPHDRARVLSALHAVLDLTTPTKQEERNDER